MPALMRFAKPLSEPGRSGGRHVAFSLPGTTATTLGRLGNGLRFTGFRRSMRAVDAVQRQFRGRRRLSAECRRQHRGIDRVVLTRIVGLAATRRTATARTGTLFLVDGRRNRSSGDGRGNDGRLNRCRRRSGPTGLALATRFTLGAHLAVGTGLTLDARLAFRTGLTLRARLTFSTGLTLGARFALRTRFTLRTGFTVGAGLALGTLLAVVLALIPRLTRFALVTAIALLAADELLALRLVGHAIIVTVVAIGVIVALAAILFEARTVLVEHTEIMIGELRIIFEHHAITLGLRIARQGLVFLMQLRSIAARTIIDAVAVISTTTGVSPLRSLPTTTATAAGLTIVDQLLAVLVFETSPAPDRTDIARLPDADHSSAI